MQTEKYVPLRVGVGKYFYGKGCIKQLTEEILRFGGRPLVIGGKTSSEIILNICKDEWTKQNISAQIYKHTGECSVNWAKKYVQAGFKAGCTVVVGIGGGKCMDLAKAVAVLGKWNIITVPTSAATCVATSAVCVMYNDEGRTDHSIQMDREVDVAIADTEIIASAPKRTLAAGIMDSVAKLVEIEHKLNISSYKDCELKQYIGFINSKGIYDFLIHEGADAYEKGISYERYTDIILTNLLHTSVVSGFCSGVSQMALAHALYDSLRKWFVEDTREAMHGEIVGIGVLMQMAFNNEKYTEFDCIHHVMEKMNMPTNLEAIGFIDTIENRRKLMDSIIEIANLDREKDMASFVSAFLCIR